VVCGPAVAHHLFLQITFFWNTATPIRHYYPLCAAPIAELRVAMETLGLTDLKYLLFDPLQWGLQTLPLGEKQILAIHKEVVSISTEK